MDQYTWRATTAFSLEGIVAGELRRIGMREVAGAEGCATFQGSMEDALLANMRLRTADRIMLEMGAFTALTFDELFEGVRAIAWEDLLPRNAALPVTGKCARSQLMSVRDVQAITKKAIVERMKKAYKIEWLPEDGASYAVDVHLHKDTAVLCVDASGAGLSRRGYRLWNGEAPLRETLAAAVVMVSPWRSDMPVMDPMCGTGTLLIEAAMIAADRAPGLLRSFAMEDWAQLPKELPTELRSALHSVSKPVSIPILGSDIDENALVLARRHAKAAGVEDFIEFEHKPLAEAACTLKHGALITNPPYGERMGDQAEVELLYSQLRVLQNHMSTWSLTALTSNPSFERAFGKRADKRRRLFNGRLECEILQFFPPKK